NCFSRPAQPHVGQRASPARSRIGRNQRIIRYIYVLNARTAPDAVLSEGASGASWPPVGRPQKGQILAPKLLKSLRRLQRPPSSRKTRGSASGKSSEMRPGPKARAAAPCSQTPAEAASKAGTPWAARPATKPV